MNDLYFTYNWGDVDPAGNKQLTNFVPVRIIFNDETTICYFEDGSKVVVTCSEDDEYTKEAGVAACIAKRVFGSRSAFLKAVEKGYRQPSKESNIKNNRNRKYVKDSQDYTKSSSYFDPLIRILHQSMFE